MYRYPSQTGDRLPIQIAPSQSAPSLIITLAIALTATTGVSAEYQQTLAARGADAYAQPPITIEIDNEALAETFANNIVEANPALSDQEVMIDLQARMQAEQRLEHAAANLDVSTEPAAQTDEREGEPAAVASR